MRRTPVQWAGLATGIVVFILLLTLDTPLKHHGEHGAQPALAAAVASMMAIWWLTEALPIQITACVPLLLFPLLGVFGPDIGTNVAEAVLPYFDPYIFLFAGGMCIAAAMQQWDLHRRIALTVMHVIGTDPRRLLFGFLAATAFISLWISNTATAAMMLPIGIAVIAQLEHQAGVSRLPSYGMAIMLSIAYGSNVGGIGTKIGTAPNAQFSGFMEQAGVEISFLQFMAVGLPFVVMFLPVVWYALWRIGRRDGLRDTSGAGVVEHELALLGRIKHQEMIVLGVFIATATVWIAGKPLTGVVQGMLPGVKISSAHVEGGVAVLAAILLLLWPTQGSRVLAVRSLRTVPWGTLLLLGGGFAMAAGIQQSGLSDWMGMQLLGVRELAPFMQVLVASIVTVGMSAVASNTATIAVMLNVLRTAVAPEIANTTLFAATIAASCDFALPAGTPPNAIVFGSGYVTIPQMARTGAILDIAAAVLAAAWCWVIVRVVLGS